MRCLGTNNNKRCENKCKFIYCKEHTTISSITKFIVLISAIPALIISIKNCSNDGISSKKTTEIKQGKAFFKPVFPTVDSTNFNILISRFEDYTAKENAYCIGRSIEEHLNVLKSTKKTLLPINVIYVDSISPPKNIEDSKRIQKSHNADLIIYGLAKNIIQDCGGAEVCFRYKVNENIFKNKYDHFDIKITKHNIEYIKTSPLEIESGILQVNALSMQNWITSLVSIKSNKPKDAVLEFSSILKDNKLTISEKQERIYAIGSLYNGLKQYEKAIEAYQQIIELKPESKAYRILGYSYTKLKQYDSAIKAFKKSLQINPKNKKTYINRGNMYFAKKKYKKAIEDYNSSLKLDSTRSFVYSNLGLSYSWLKNYDKAIKYYDFALIKDSKDKKSYRGKGFVYKKLKQYDKAFEFYGKAISIDSLFADPYSYRGYLYLITDNYEKAIEDLTKYINLHPNNHDWVDYSNRASAYLEVGKYNNAINDCEKAISLNPKATVTYDILSSIFIAKKEYNKALININKAISIDSTKATYYRTRGVINRNLKNRNNALIDYNKSISLDSTNAYSYKLKGNLFYFNKKYEKAILEFTKALNINPNYYGAYHYRGHSFYKLSEYENAIKDFKKGNDLNNDYIEYYRDLFKVYIWKYWFITISLLLLLIYYSKTDIKNFYLKFTKNKK